MLCNVVALSKEKASQVCTIYCILLLVFMSNISMDICLCLAPHMTTYKLSFFFFFFPQLLKYTQDSVVGLVRKWEEGFGFSYKENDWHKSIHDIHSVFVSNRFREMQFRIFHRQHRTSYILNKMNPSRLPLCLTCKQSPGTSQNINILVLYIQRDK